MAKNERMKRGGGVKAIPDARQEGRRGLGSRGYIIETAGGERHEWRKKTGTQMGKD